MDNIIIQFLNKLLIYIQNLNFVYRASQDITDNDSNSILVSNTISTTGTSSRTVEELSDVDTYRQQQTAKQSSILQWCNTVRKKVV